MFNNPVLQVHQAVMYESHTFFVVWGGFTVSSLIHSINSWNRKYGTCNIVSTVSALGRSHTTAHNSRRQQQKWKRQEDATTVAHHYHPFDLPKSLSFSIAMRKEHFSQVSRAACGLVAILSIYSNEHFHPATDAFSFSSVSKNRPATSKYESLIALALTTIDGEEPTATATTTRKKPLSPKEILERQREMQGLSADEDEYPKLFEDEMLDNMKQMLLSLEKRVQEGPGSLTILEVEEFMSMSQSVLTDMKEKERQRLQDAATPPSPQPSPFASIETAAVATVAPSTPALQTATASPTSAVAMTDLSSTTLPPPTIEVQKSTAKEELENAEDGPAFDPSGGNGSLARGTRNTYVIPNMDEMSPEEYQKALQQSLFDQQVARRKRMQAGYGNRASWDYLNNLTGESGQLKPDSAFEE
jgi:hypothetical protein